MKLNEFVAGLNGSWVPGLPSTYEKFPILAENDYCPSCGFLCKIPVRKILCCMIDNQWSAEQITGWLEMKGYNHNAR